MKREKNKGEKNKGEARLDWKAFQSFRHHNENLFISMLIILSHFFLLSPLPGRSRGELDLVPNILSPE